MNEDTWKRIDEALEGFEDVACGNGSPVTDQEINAAEERLALRFPDDFQEFLKRYGAASIGSYHLFGLRPNVLCPLHLIEENLRCRELGFEEVSDWVVISDDGRGNPIGIAVDGRVLRADKYYDFEIDELASSFEVFLRRRCLELIE